MAALVVDVVSVWGVAWMVGTLAAYRTRPHLLLPGELRVRSGVQHDLRVPASAVVSAVARELPTASSVFALQVEDGGVSLGVGGQINVVVELAPGTLVRTHRGVVEAGSLRLWADDPRALAARLTRLPGQDPDRSLLSSRPTR